MSSSAITTQVAQLKIGSVQNQADSSGVYSAGVWSFKNSTALTSVTITDAGDLRIGTTSNLGFADKLTVVGGSIAIQRTAGITTAIGDNTQQGYVGTVSNHPFLFYSNATERMRISPTGTVDIGLNAGYGGLNLAKTGNLSPGVFLWINATATNQKYVSFEYNGNGGSGSITPNGTGNVAFNTGPSDYRLKDEVVELSGGLEKIKSLRPVAFKWKKSGETDVGFIAHEIQQVIPQCVNGDKDAVDEEGNPSHQSIFPAPAQMIANLVAAIQELSAKVDAQAEEIKALKAQP